MKFSSDTKLVVKTALLSTIFTVTILMLSNYFLDHSWSLFSNASNTRPFTVQGTSSLTQKPDEAQVSFAVIKIAPTLQDAQNQANTQTNAIVSDLKKMGIAQNDIKTSNYSSYPNTPNVYNMRMMPVQIPTPQISQIPTGYTVTENADITLHDIAKANNVIGTITKDGAENVSGPNLTFSETMRQSLTNKARIQAITDAKQKAQSIADAAGIRLGRILNIQENNAPYPIEPMMNEKAMMDTSNSTPTQISPGENTITETITLYYATW